MSGKRLKVLHIFSTLPVGGAEMLMLNIAKNIDRDRFDISVCCLAEKGVLGRQIEECGIEVVSLGFRKAGGLNIPLLRRLREFIKERDFDIVHTHMYHANFYGRLAAWLTGVPVIVSSVHNIYRKRKKHRMVINRILSKITDTIFVATETIKADVMNYDRTPAEKIEVIPYGIDIEPFAKKYDRPQIREKLGLNSEEFVIGNVARLEPAKGQRFLIEAVKTLKERGFHVKCLIIGSGSLEQELKSMSERIGIADNVLFPGTRSDLPELFSAMDIFVFPSLWEGLPLALLSAMAAGLPVITTNAGGIKDVIVDGENGVVVPFSNPSAIADEIVRLMEHHELRKRLSERAREEIIRNYSARVMTKRLEDKYEVLIQN